MIFIEIECFFICNQSLQGANINQSIASRAQSIFCTRNFFLGSSSVRSNVVCVVQSFNEVVPSYKAIIFFCKLLCLDRCNQILQGLDIYQSFLSSVQCVNCILNFFNACSIYKHILCIVKLFLKGCPRVCGVIIFIEIECFFICNQSLQFADINQLIINIYQSIVSIVNLFLRLCIVYQSISFAQRLRKVVPRYSTVLRGVNRRESINQSLQFSIIKLFRDGLLNQCLYCFCQFSNHALYCILILCSFKQCNRLCQYALKGCPRISVILVFVQVRCRFYQKLQLAYVNQSIASRTQSIFCSHNIFLGSSSVRSNVVCVVQSFNEVVPSYKAIIAFCKLLSFDFCNQSLQGANINQSVMSFLQLSNSIIDVFLRFCVHKHILCFVKLFLKGCPRVCGIITAVKIFYIINQVLQLADVYQSRISFVQLVKSRLNVGTLNSILKGIKVYLCRHLEDGSYGQLTEQLCSFIQSFLEVLPRLCGVVAFNKVIVFNLVNLITQIITKIIDRFKSQAGASICQIIVFSINDRLQFRIVY